MLLQIKNLGSEYSWTRDRKSVHILSNHIVKPDAYAQDQKHLATIISISISERQIIIKKGKVSCRHKKQLEWVERQPLLVCRVDSEACKFPVSLLESCSIGCDKILALSRASELSRVNTVGPRAAEVNVCDN